MTDRAQAADRTHAAQTTSVNSSRRSIVVGHVLLPLLPSAVLYGLYVTPLSVIDCPTRGLIAGITIIATLLGGIAAAALGLRARSVGGPPLWWMVSALLCLLPALMVFGPLA